MNGKLARRGGRAAVADCIRNARVPLKRTVRNVVMNKPWTRTNRLAGTATECDKGEETSRAGRGIKYT